MFDLRTRKRVITMMTALLLLFSAFGCQRQTRTEEPLTEAPTEKSLTEAPTERTAGSSETPATSGTPQTSEMPETSGTPAESGSEDPGPSGAQVHPPCPPLTWLEDLDVPPYSGRPYAVVNDNTPFFDPESLVPVSYETYYELDELGRCTLADAVVGRDLQPTGKRGNIGSIKPTGWHTDRYSFVDGGALYNRCHLLAYYLTAENANPWNLVTGTRYMNQDGMNDFENLVGDFVKETGLHVRYRVTPVWTGENLLCDGLLVEGLSIEDGGEGICFCIFAYNVQPGVHIDYLTGDNYAENGEEPLNQTTETEEPELPTTDPDVTGTYVLNTKKKKFHTPDCPGAASISEKNRGDYTGSRNALILDGYTPDPACSP